LLQTDEQHKEKHEQLSSWLAEKEAYLKKKEEIDTVSKAHLHLRYMPFNIPLFSLAYDLIIQDCWMHTTKRALLCRTRASACGTSKLTSWLLKNTRDLTK